MRCAVPIFKRAGQIAYGTHEKKGPRRGSRYRRPGPAEFGLKFPEKYPVSKQGANTDRLNRETGGHNIVTVKIF